MMTSSYDGSCLRLWWRAVASQELKCGRLNDFVRGVIRNYPESIQRRFACTPAWAGSNSARAG